MLARSPPAEGDNTTAESSGSLRPIAPVVLAGVEPGGTPRALPIFDWVDPASLLIDEGYQRNLSNRSMRLIRKIVTEWDWARFKPPVVVKTEAGLECIDGQHTAIGAATHPHVKTIPVMIIEVEERAERAAAFIGHNRDRIGVTAMQLHFAAVAAGDPIATEVEEACRLAGVTIVRSQSSESLERQTVAVGTLAALVKQRGSETVAAFLKVLADAGCAPISATQLKAVDLLMTDPEYNRELNANRLVNAIRSSPDAEQKAKVFVAAHVSTPLWQALAIQWFKARKKRSDLVVAGGRD